MSQSPVVPNERSVPPRPASLFKYQPPTEYALENLRARRLWFGDPASFDDPYDHETYLYFRSPPPGDLLKLAAFWKERNPEAPDPPPGFFDSKENRQLALAALESEGRNMLRRVFRQGIACFSAIGDSIPLWSHYGAQHHGFCLEFDTSYAPFSDALPVIYQGDIPAFTLSDALLHGDSDGAFRSMLLTKHQSWDYQQEWRLFHESRSSSVTFDARSLRAVYLGCRLDHKVESRILTVLTHTGALLFKASLSEQRYGVQYELLL